MAHIQTNFTAADMLGGAAAKAKEAPKKVAPKKAAPKPVVVEPVVEAVVETVVEPAELDAPAAE